MAYTYPGPPMTDSGNFSSATSFPQPILMGAAFDDELIFDVASVVSTEARAFSNAGLSGLDYWVSFCFESSRKDRFADVFGRRRI